MVRGFAVAVCLLAAQAADAAKPVGLMTLGRRHASTAEATAVRDFLLQDARVASEVRAWFAPDEFSRYAVVVIPTIKGKPARPWTDEDIKLALAYVEAGGVIVFVGGGPVYTCGKGRNLRRIEGLLGGRTFGKIKGKAKVLDANDPLTKGLAIRDGAWAESSAFLSGLTSAKPILGLRTKDGPVALVAVNRVGKGRVYVFVKEYFRMLTAKTPGREAYGQMMKRAILSAAPARKPPPKERWIPKPLWR